MGAQPSQHKEDQNSLVRFQDRRVHEAKHACLLLIENYNKTNGGRVDGFCPPIWDEIMCWEETKAGETVQQPCVPYIIHFSPQQKASKQCLANGSWFKMYDERPSWTNFTQCLLHNESDSNEDDKYSEVYLPALKRIADTGYSLSLLSLLVAFTIIISIKKLRCPRNVLHLHLFASFIMRATMTLVRDFLFDTLSRDVLTMYAFGYRTHEIEENITLQGSWLCAIVMSLWQYFIMANYTWILMEGLYLHNLIFQALFTDSSSISLYILLGWGLPFLFVTSWTLCKAFLENEYCWSVNDNTTIFLLIRGPITTSILINFILFIRIIMVLLKKLQASVCEETKTYRRWAKSTLVLIPLFGVHYMVFHGFQYSTNRTVVLVWLFADQLFACFNGFLIALLYCFLNGEVRNELNKKWSNFSFRELLENWHLSGPDSIFSSSRYFGDRYRRPRESCYSNSCTVDTIVHSCNRDKKRQATTVTVATQEICSARGERKGLMAMKDEVKCITEISEVKNGFSHCGKDRRWSTADCDTDTNAVELKRMTTSNNNIE